MNDSWILDELDKNDLIDEAVQLLGNCCGRCRWRGMKLDFSESHSPLEICTAFNPTRKFISKYETCPKFSSAYNV